MKRDMELVRKLLLYIEENHVCNSSINSYSIEIAGFSDDQIDYHIEIMLGSGLINAKYPKMNGRNLFLIDGLSWYGHEFLDSIRDDGIWRKVTDTAKPLGSLSFDIIANLATSFIRSQLGLS